MSTARLSLRQTPESLKQRLRPLLVRTVAVLRALPGGPLGLALMRRLMPGTHAWLRRRYSYYVDAGLGRPALPQGGVAAGDLDGDARRIVGWLRPPTADRI